MSTNLLSVSRRLVLASAVLKSLKERDREYGEYRKECHEDGYAPEYCVHGTKVNDWTGADLMCGRCEDGYSWDVPDMRAREALEVADSMLHDYERKREAVRKVREILMPFMWRHDGSVPQSATMSLDEWAYDPIYQTIQRAKTEVRA